MSNTGSGGEGRHFYSNQEDQVIAKHYKGSWSMVEIAYQLHKQCKTLRSPAAINKRLVIIRQEKNIDKLKHGPRYITQEAIEWSHQTLKHECVPSNTLRLREHRNKSINGHGKLKKSKARELIGLTKTKGSDEPNPSYTVLTSRLVKSGDLDTLHLFQRLLETAMAEGKTVIDVVDDLRLIGA